jgi:hypothetical protein
MRSTVGVRKALVEKYLAKTPIPSASVAPLREALKALQAIPREGPASLVALDKDRKIALDLGYEINELVKDIFFLEHSEEEFLGYLNDLHEDFQSQVTQGVEALRGIRFKAFLTDRDGTVNNYCGRYASSVQSVYNAVFLTRFATAAAQNSVILTSAPLDNIGLVDIAVSPEHVFTLAGSKGREYFNTRGQRCVFPIQQEKQARLDALNAELAMLLKRPEFERYGLIGSGLQFKFGQTTVARQDITRSIPQPESDAFLDTLRGLVARMDPGGDFFRIEDTGLDVEIVLTIDAPQGSEAAKDFDKGDGIKFLNEDMDLGMSGGVCLICGDTNADVPMVSTSLSIARETHAVFVTRSDELKNRVRGICSHALFVSEPDMLVTILNNLAKQRE